MNQRAAATQITCEIVRAIATIQPSPDPEGTADEAARAEILGRLLSEASSITLQPDPLFGYEGEAALVMVVKHAAGSPARLSALMGDMTDEQKRVTLDLFQRIAKSYPGVMG